MLPSSHLVPINLPREAMCAGADELADAFSEFSFAASRLEKSYQELQKEVTQLRAILAERNQALRTSQAEHAQVKLALRHIVDALPCGVIVLEDNRQVTLINPEARRLLGLSDEKVELLDETPLGRHSSLTATMECLANDGTEAEDELCIATPSATRWLGVRSRRFQQDPGSGTSTTRVATGQRQQTILIVRDNTSHKKLEQEREDARNVVALAEMSAVLAHEIRNPLASLELFAGLIGETNSDAAEYVAHLRAGIRTLSATVNNVLRLHGGGTLELSRIILGDALHSAVEFVRPLAEQQQIALSLTDTTEKLAIAGDKNAIQQLVMNLALNAFRHTPVGGSVQVSASKAETSGTRAKVVFSDSGCGIAPDELAHIFEPGFSGNGQSPGLGLAVCRKIVEQHSGTIRVSSSPGAGTSFAVELPTAL